MRVHRGFLGWGVFFIVLGLVPLADQLGWIPGVDLSQAWRLWPLFLVGAGVGLLLRRTPLEALGGLIVAATAGLLLGSFLAVGPSLGVTCGPPGNASTVASQGGSLGPGSSVSIDAACARVNGRAGPGADWTVAWGPQGDDAPRIAETGGGLVVANPGQAGTPFGGSAGSLWDVTVPSGSADRLTIEVDAGTARIPLDGLVLDSAILQSNAADVRVDLGGSTVVRIDGEVNVGSLRVGLPRSGLTTGRLGANLSSLVLCAPADLPMRIQTDGTHVGWDLPGLTQNGSVYETPGFTATNGVTLRIEANLSSVRLEREGSCR
ncbi:MAG: DUF5668 domain-containing protein [Chloroflexi bacterium]|nr:DUF5668 domain-containing protein [Chloroflexota bacterium]